MIESEELSVSSCKKRKPLDFSEEESEKRIGRKI